MLYKKEAIPKDVRYTPFDAVQFLFYSKDVRYTPNVIMRNEMSLVLTPVTGRPNSQNRCARAAMIRLMSCKDPPSRAFTTDGS
mmetsp:Transcript_31462/g.76760  ORF Transcript_31462/g.76760 Transcript_31462/m.76760 type:complete len:83 (+) Transcript_31462:375-623(+)